MIVLAAALLLVPVAEEKRGPPTWTVEAEGSTQTMIGFVAFGKDDDLKRLGDAAKNLGLKTARIAKEKTPEKLPELMVVFDEGITKQAALAIFNAASRGEYGALKVGSMLMPAKAVAP